jgi:mono/diheme cytochrome c family protein
MKIAKLALVVLGAAAGTAVLAYGTIWGLGERIIARKNETPPLTISASDDPATIKEGERLSNVAGCLGCHGEGMNGKLFGEAPFIYRSVSANAPRLAKTYSDEDFARAIRHGVRKNGRSVIGMPSPAFYDMRDEDLVAIISFIRTLTDRGEKLPKSGTFILGRLELIQGLFPPEASTIDHQRARREYDFSIPEQRGEYLARIACSECHGLDFKGAPSFEGEKGPPDLAIAAAYTPEQFAHLMITGEPVGGRELRLMGDVARSRFPHFTDEEIGALHAFFLARASSP